MQASSGSIAEDEEISKKLRPPKETIQLVRPYGKTRLLTTIARLVYADRAFYNTRSREVFATRWNRLLTENGCVNSFIAPRQRQIEQWPNSMTSTSTCSPPVMQADTISRTYLTKSSVSTLFSTELPGTTRIAQLPVYSELLQIWLDR